MILFCHQPTKKQFHYLTSESYTKKKKGRSFEGMIEQ